MELFDKKSRNDKSPRRWDESIYSYLDRSSEPCAIKAREIINKCLSNYNQENSKDIISRLRKNDANINNSVFFELILFYIFCKLGYTIEVHPNLKNGSNDHPDFLITDKENSQFYIEAVSASDLHQESIKQENILKKFIAELDKGINSSEYYLHIKIKKYPNNQPSSKNALKEIQQWLDKNENTFEWSCKKSNCEIIFEKAERLNTQKKYYSSIGSIVYPIRRLNKKAVRNAVKKKKKKYGTPSIPLILCINLYNSIYHEDDIIEHLFGNIEIKTFHTPDGPKSIEYRNKEGPFHDKKANFISGVWVFDDINLFKMIAKNAIFINPCAKYNIPDSLKKICRYYDFVYTKCGENENLLNDIFTGDTAA